MQHPPAFSIKRLWPTVKRLFSAMSRSPKADRRRVHAGGKLLLAAIVILTAIALIAIYYDERAGLATAQSRYTIPGWYWFFHYYTNVGKTLFVMLVGVPIAVLLACNYWPVRGFASIRRRFGIYSDANYVLFSVGFAGGGASFLKNLIGRGRPRFLDSHGTFYFDFARFDADYASFPSGHSATSGALAVALSLIFPRFKWLFLFMGCLGGVSRVVVGAHYPSDVVAGLVWGGAVSLLIAHYLRRRGLLFANKTSLWPERHR